MGRAPCCEKVGLKRGRWTSEEDEILSNYILCHGEGSWRSLPKNAGLLRCGKSCRLRWINYLRSDLKRGNITPQEEDIIIRLHSTLGNRWSTIAGHLPGRTDNEIKNYWNSHLSRRIHTYRKPNGEEKIVNLTNASAPPKRRGGRTSRATMQSNKTNNAFKSLEEGKNLVLDKENEMLMGIEDIMNLDGLEMEINANPIGPNEVDGLNVGPIRKNQEHPKNNVSMSTSSNGGESTSSSSTLSCFDNIDWNNMEIGMVDDLGVDFKMCSEKEQVISWLWENDDNYLEKSIMSNVAVGVDNYEQEQAMVAWLLS